MQVLFVLLWESEGVEGGDEVDVDEREGEGEL
jgi:hypothetical protein